MLGRLFDVRDLRAVVTGAASGLGFAMAEVLADCGARVTLADIDADLLEQSTSALAERGCRVRSEVVDVSDADAGAGPLRRRRRGRGRASTSSSPTPGSARCRASPSTAGSTLDSIERSDWDRVIGVNLHGIMFTIGSAAAVMKRQGSGRIVVTSSVAGLRPEPVVCYGYIASKAAIVNVVRQAALDLAPHGVHINAICPGPVQGHADRRRAPRSTRIPRPSANGPRRSRCGGWQKSRR